MIEKLRDMEKLRQEMKLQAMQVAFEKAQAIKYDCDYEQLKANLDKQEAEVGSRYLVGFSADWAVWQEAWQAAQEQMLQETTWNNYSIISPTNEGRYQIFINGEQLAADWIDKFGFADPFDGDALRQDLITHWQSLPQPPKQ